MGNGTQVYYSDWGAGWRRKRNGILGFMHSDFLCCRGSWVAGDLSSYFPIHIDTRRSSQAPGCLSVQGLLPVWWEEISMPMKQVHHFVSTPQTRCTHHELTKVQLVCT